MLDPPLEHLYLLWEPDLRNLEVHFVFLVAHLVEEFPRMLNVVANTLLHGLNEPKLIRLVASSVPDPNLIRCRPEEGPNLDHNIIPA